MEALALMKAGRYQDGSPGTPTLIKCWMPCNRKYWKWKTEGVYNSPLKFLLINTLCVSFAHTKVTDVMQVLLSEF